DITERKLAEEALRESKEHYQQLFNEAHVMQENLRDLSTKVLHVQEQERTRISRELHDQVGSALTAINVDLAVLRREPTLKPALIRQRITDTQTLLEQTMETVHRFARELRPSMLDHLGLLPALRSYAKSFVERTRIDVRFRGNAEAEKLDSERKTVLYRVAQESLTNVAKHARASKVMMSLRKVKGQIRLEIQDNGCSFDLNQLNGNKRLGLLGMQERVRLVNGRFAINSECGKGTTVRVEIPFKAQSANPDAPTE
ncbi:MAG: sensor histidine kinase, partial [Verrucomicrobia bacterium]|nr:sensor histidine kinase [Verrucomicrobiota bacterium]